MTLCADSNTIGHKATQNLTPTIEAEPDIDTAGLFIFGVPLRGEEGKTGGYGCFEDTEAGLLVCCHVNKCV